MSEQQRVQVDVNALVQQLQSLEQYIAALQATIDQLNATLQTLYAGERALEELKSSSGEVEALVDLDGGGIVYGVAKLPAGDTRVLIHAGLDLYIEVPVSKALEIIRERQADTARVLDSYRRELAKAVEAYENLRGLLEQAIRAARSQ